MRRDHESSPVYSRVPVLLYPTPHTTPGLHGTTPTRVLVGLSRVDVSGPALSPSCVAPCYCRIYIPLLLVCTRSIYTRIRQTAAVHCAATALSWGTLFVAFRAATAVYHIRQQRYMCCCVVAPSIMLMVTFRYCCTLRRCSRLLLLYDTAVFGDFSVTQHTRYHITFSYYYCCFCIIHRC